ncbi:polyprotein [Phytophthora megakarya]|uniref:Polyprotein n=1 Tax=Phytophthora megakarya TaxID=4795 RepID=A0A225WR36_9STRA|nr:polyprotein [Phytophthora megakarya]
MHYAGIRVLRYLKGTQFVALVFNRSSTKNVHVAAYSDANWGGDMPTRRSTSGVLVLMDGCPIIFKSKRQTAVALSTAEAEYMALALATQNFSGYISYLVKWKFPW